MTGLVEGIRINRINKIPLLIIDGFGLSPLIKSSLFIRYYIYYHPAIVEYNCSVIRRG